MSWGKPDDPTIRQYEIEYELLDRESDIGTKSPVEAATPISVKCKATVMEKTIDKLIPDKKYNFRIRSLNTAGWGRWSAPTTCHYPGFPLSIEYTGEIIEIIIPTDGLYCITARGAKATDGNTKKGGRGAIIEAKFLLNKYTSLYVLRNPSIRTPLTTLNQDTPEPLNQDTPEPLNQDTPDHPQSGHS